MSVYDVGRLTTSFFPFFMPFFPFFLIDDNLLVLFLGRFAMSVRDVGI